MTWDAVHRRGEVLRAVVDEADTRLDGTLPMDLPGVAEVFDDELSLIAALAMRWHTRLTGAIEHALMDHPDDLETAVVEGWRENARALPGVRLVLDRHTQEPLDDAMGEALRRARRKEWAELATLAGHGNGTDDPSLEVGRRIEAAARAGLTAPRPRERSHGEHGSLMRRLRAVVAA